MNITWFGGIAIIWIVIMFVRGYSRGFIKEVVSFLITVFSLVLVWMINPYVSDFLKEKTPVYKKMQETSQNLVENTLDKTGLTNASSEQKIIEQLPIPQFLKDKLAEDNTKENYQYLKVKDFLGYLSGYLSLALMKGLSFFISYLLVNVVLRILAGVLDLIAKLPILNGINRVVGACLGGIEGVAILWIILLGLTLLCSTEFGKAGMNLVEKDSVLSFLYEHDLFIKMFMNAFH